MAVSHFTQRSAHRPCRPDCIVLVRPGLDPACIGRADLVQLEQNGYKPLASDAQYPQNVQVAEQRIQPNQPMLAQADT